MDDTRKSSSERGYVETLFGRRLYLPEINSSNGMRRQAAERTAINAPMQGTAADIIKLAMIEVDSWLSKEGLSSRMIMQVHDELVLEVPEVEEGIIREGLVKLMTGVVNLSIPLLVDLGSGANWDEAH
jgi:DNA polymerase-1